jgi:hypothetical protein
VPFPQGLDSIAIYGCAVILIIATLWALVLQRTRPDLMAQARHPHAWEVEPDTAISEEESLATS